MKVVYFVLASGRRPVEEFVDGLNIRSQRKFMDKVELLESFGRKLTAPHAKYIGSEIFELRLESVEGAIRVLYFFFAGDKAVLTNGFIKKTNKTPVKEKETAVVRKEIYFQEQQGGAS
ncbi:MAG: type II toxin-antitoxin system RelE/ParE family toxin [Candidatus Omnitrophica bacterium]|nr:type II toxin-antitoxin system RelE/ParE family toxin [Candidatus Omnitrophota bacterium]